MEPVSWDGISWYLGLMLAKLLPITKLTPKKSTNRPEKAPVPNDVLVLFRIVLDLQTLERSGGMADRHPVPERYRLPPPPADHLLWFPRG